jgi:hypothetical protein
MFGRDGRTKRQRAGTYVVESIIGVGEEPAAVPGEQAASQAAEPSGEPSGRSAQERLISTQEAARLLGMTKRGVQLAAEHDLIAFRLQRVGLGYQRLYLLSDVMAYADERDARFARRSRGRSIAEQRSRAGHQSAPEAT